MDREFSRLNLATLAPLLIERIQFDYVVECIVEMAEDESLEDLAIDCLIDLVEAWESEFPEQFMNPCGFLLMMLLLSRVFLPWQMRWLGILYFRLHLSSCLRIWRKRHAALVALAQISQRCSKVMIENSEQVVTMVLNSFHDPHPRVRWAAIDAIEELSIYLGPHLQLQYHARVLPALASAMDDFENPQVQFG
ncbi:importin subunit beta-3 [Artemisia annua]|uniref:Importin subunit beta-3 n=1 Tax=Artemisia annua TaxID=35608 RepID=A0A2U1PJA0_ARTAN|nr:importin subunit beta-3 [Artemisia annua]